MSKEKTVYRVSGSAALKPEHVDQSRSTASIIDFESVRQSSYEGNRKALKRDSTSTWASYAASDESFVSSLKNAFMDHGKVSGTDSGEVAKIVGFLTLIGLVIAFLGA